MKEILILLALLACYSAPSCQSPVAEGAKQKRWLTQFDSILYARTHNPLSISYPLPLEQAVYNQLKSYRQDSNISRIYFANFNNKINVSPRVKLSLLHMLKNEWTEEEREAYTNSRVKRDFTRFLEGNIKNLKQEIQGLNSDTVMTVINKALQKKFLQEINNEINNGTVDPEIIKTVAWLDMKEVIPFLKITFLNNAKQYERHIVALALARLGDTTYENYISNYKNQFIRHKDLANGNWRELYEKSFDELAFIGTQNSVYHIHEWMDTIRTTYIVSDGNTPNTRTFVSTYLIERLRRLIKNPELTQIVDKLYTLTDYTHVDVFVRATPELVTEVKKWLIINRGKYIINREYF